MMADPSRVIVTAVDHPFHTVHALCVHHRDFPEVRSEDNSAEAAAVRLAERLSASLDSASSGWRREMLECAIEDVRAFASQART
jgi:hypothetical protein